jgi:cyclopropane fatty-acyl-phospholipid synthase-like methyltransferase
LTQDQRGQFDQFHAGGTEAVDRVLEHLDVGPGMRVLDVGSGFGGPARHVAASSGCTVLGIDITREYVEVAESLTRAAGLDASVGFVWGELAALDQGDFDAAYTMHVQMNVADKPGFFAEIARHLRPGARLGVFEVCRVAESEPELPLPWSLDGSDSHLVTPAELREAILGSGFEVLEWVDETEPITNWFDEIGARLAAGDGGAALPDLLDDGPLRLINFAAALASGVLAVYRGSFVVPASGPVAGRG